VQKKDARGRSTVKDLYSKALQSKKLTIEKRTKYAACQKNKESQRNTGGHLGYDKVGDKRLNVKNTSVSQQKQEESGVTKKNRWGKR